MSQTTAMELVEKPMAQRWEGLDIQCGASRCSQLLFPASAEGQQIIRLLNVAILHDVVEDYAQEGYTLERVQSMVG